MCRSHSINAVAGIAGTRHRPYFFKQGLNEAGTFRSPGELAAQLRDVIGNTPPDRVVCCCGPGVTACHAQLAFEHAGLHGARLYPGSWSETWLGALSVQTPAAHGIVVSHTVIASTIGANVMHDGGNQEMLAHNGVMTRADLMNPRALKRAPLMGTYRGYEIIAMPPPESGRRRDSSCHDPAVACGRVLKSIRAPAGEGVQAKGRSAWAGRPLVSTDCSTRAETRRENQCTTTELPARTSCLAACQSSSTMA